MKEKELQRYRKMILEKREELLEEVRRRRQQEMEKDSSEVRDSLDQADVTYNADFELTLRQSHLKQIKEMDEALEKIDEGSFGHCQNCGELIPEKRLAVRPNARYCIDCKSEIEKRGGTP